MNIEEFKAIMTNEDVKVMKELGDYYDRLKNEYAVDNRSLADMISTITGGSVTPMNVPIADGVEISVVPNLIDGIPLHFFNDKIKRAHEFAGIVHHGQKYGTHPYTKHLADTYKVFLEFVIEPVYGKDAMANKVGVIDKYQDVACALWLHDSIEDTSTNRDEIEEYFGPDVADLVDAVSGVGSNRKERLASMARKCEDRPDAVIIKLCDRIANTRNSSNEHFSGEHKPTSLFVMYVDEFPAFKEAIGGYYADVAFVKKMWDYLESISKE